MRAPSAGDVLLALISIPTAGLMADEFGPAFCADTTALFGRVEGGRVVCARGEG